MKRAEDARRLRGICVGYPRQMITEAVNAVIGAAVVDANERHAIVALVASWLSEEGPLTDPPPLDSAMTEAIRRELRDRAH